MQFDLMPQEFHTGLCFDAYRQLGAHPHPKGGWQFRIWAPEALCIQVTGDFNQWQGTEMVRDEAGVWGIVIPEAKAGQYYKYNIQGRDEEWQEHSDPYAFYSELRPGTASVLYDISYFNFDDDAYVAARSQRYDLPMNIYEVHAGSWLRREDGSPCTWPELTDTLIPWLHAHHYNFVELLPLAEHPFDGSWGYQITGYFSLTSRYGTPKEFAAFVNACHKAGIGVIMDYVPVHFAVNADGLARLDGAPLYEYDSDVGQSEWGTCNFNFYRGEVRSFLSSAAAFWMDVYHCDGLRMDAISRAIYWQGDSGRGVNEGALEFIQILNRGLHYLWPGCILAAEDSTDFLKVTAPVQYEGLGFDYKWDMGWMHDTLNYFATPFIERPGHYNKITFSMSYFYNELYILPFSHDEVVHGKHTIIDKLWGSYEEKFAQARLLYLYMMTHPGKKLNFMGNELAMFREWDETRQMDWHLLKYPAHDSFDHFIRRLGELYMDTPALYSGEYHPQRFQWLISEAREKGVYAYTRSDVNGRTLMVVLNTQNARHIGFPIYFDGHRTATPILFTGSSQWGGDGKEPTPVSTYPGGVLGKSHTLYLDLEPLCGYVFELN